MKAESNGTSTGNEMRLGDPPKNIDVRVDCQRQLPQKFDWSAVKSALNAAARESTSATGATVQTSCNTAATKPAASKPDEILPGLFLGGMDHAADFAMLHALGIRNVLNATGNVSNFFENHDASEDPDSDSDEGKRLNYLRLALRDVPTQTLSEVIPIAVDFIHTCLVDRQESVLVHCAAGVSRSASLVISYLVTKQNYTLLQARDHCVRIRPQVCPNAGFWMQLRKRFCSEEFPTELEEPEQVVEAWETYRTQPGSPASNSCWCEAVRQLEPCMATTQLATIVAHALECSVYVHLKLEMALAALVNERILNSDGLLGVFDAAVASIDMQELLIDAPLAEE